MLKSLSRMLQKSTVLLLAGLCFAIVVVVRAETPDTESAQITSASDVLPLADLPPRSIVHAPFNQQYPAEDLGSTIMA